MLKVIDLDKIGTKVSGHRCDYAVKFRSISSPIDARFWLKTFNYEDLDIATKLFHSDRNITAKIWANSKTATFKIRPTPRNLSWLCLVLSPNPDEARNTAELRMDREFQISPNARLGGRVTFCCRDRLPKVFVNSRFRKRLGPVQTNTSIKGTFTPQDVAYGGLFQVGLKLGPFPRFSIDSEFNMVSRPAEISHILRFDAGFFRCGIAWQWPNRLTRIAVDAKIANKLVVGFVSAPNKHEPDATVVSSGFMRLLSASSLGFKWEFKGGYFGVAWTVQNAMLAKAKYIYDERYEFAGIVKVEEYDFSKAGFSLSVCILPDPKEKMSPMAKLNSAVALPPPVPSIH
jgi:hypothetical protein